MFTKELLLSVPHGTVLHFPPTVPSLIPVSFLSRVVRTPLQSFPALNPSSVGSESDSGTPRVLVLNDMSLDPKDRDPQSVTGRPSPLSIGGFVKVHSTEGKLVAVERPRTVSTFGKRPV